jgi:hypothetical protein
VEVNKIKVTAGIFLTILLLTLGACQSDPVTTIVTETKTVTANAQTVTITPEAQTVTVTQTSTATTTVVATQTLTSSTTKTSTTTKTSSTATTTSTTSFTPVTSPDGKLQITTATMTGFSTGTDATRISVRGVVQNLSDETLKARITVEILTADGVAGTYTTDLSNIAAGAQKSFLVETDLSSAGTNPITATGFNITVTVIS